MKALINITNFHEAYDILAGSKYYYEIMNNINSYIRNIRSVNDLDKLLKNSSFLLPHGEKVVEMSVDIAKALNLSNKQIEVVSISARYHDSAYAFYPQEIQDTLNLHNESQLQAILAHPYISAELVGALFQSKEVFYTILAHHELFSGDGFPYKFKKDNIPLESAILGIVDFYYTLTDKHHFFNPFTREEVIMCLYQNINILYSESLFYEFIRSLRKKIWSEESHFIEIDRKLSAWRNLKKESLIDYHSVYNRKNRKSVSNFENTLKQIVKKDDLIKWSI